MALADAVKEIMDARGLRTADVARRLGEGYDRATFYRILNGATTEPRLGTLVGLCRVLEVSPTELLQLAELWPHRERPVDTLDLQLRNAFAQLRLLPFEDKRRVVSVVSLIGGGWEPKHDQATANGITG